MDKLVVTCLRGARLGARQEFRKAHVTLGRRPDNDVVFPEDDAKVSGRHAEVLIEEGRWVVRDLGSLNGTWVGEQRLAAPHPLGPGAVIELGNGGPLVRLEVLDGEARMVEATQMSTPALVDQADRSARRGTAFYRFLIDDTVKKSNRKLRWIIVGLSAAFVAAIAIVWAVLSTETDRLSNETAANQAASRAAQSIASRFGPSVFMLISSQGASETGFCTAFAISTDGVLATNAHCVRELKDLRGGGARILARMNNAPESTYEVKTWKEHPDYDGTGFSPDVAVLGVDLRGATLPVAAELATPEVALALAAGQPIFTIGFPGQVMNEAKPAADLRAAVISRLTTRDNTSGDPHSAYVVWHSALTSKGTSGSPIFDTEGRVVAINNGGLSAREIMVADPKTGRMKKEIISEATGLNYGIRVDRLVELLATK